MLFASWKSYAQTDSTQNKKYAPSKRPTYKPKDRYGDEFNDTKGKSPFYDTKLKDKKTEVEIDESGQFYRVNEKMNGFDVRQPTEMTYDQYKAYQKRQTVKNFYAQKAKENDEKTPQSAKSKSLVPRIYMNPSLDRIFGGNYIDVKLNGSVLIDFGYNIQSVDNPSTPVNLRTVGAFRFDQNIAMNAQGKIGEKLRLTINQDTKSQFDFDNTIKIDYTASETEIIQKIEAGNVSLPLNNSLISGAQNLFGLKATLRFGRLTAIAVAAQQRGRGDEVKVEGGAQVRKFEIRANEYQDNQHYFLSHFFRDKYEQSLATIPFINSGIMVTRVEVWVTNRDNTTLALKNIAAFMDLGEKNPHNKSDIFPAFSDTLMARNSANSLNSIVEDRNNISRNSDNITNRLSAVGLENGNDYELLRNAKLLEPSRYRFHPQLGYISLNSPLSRDDVMGVAFEYSYRGQVFRVGELVDDYSKFGDDQKAAIVVKLLRPSNIRTDVPMWDLQMKNIYSVGSTQLSRENFQFRVTYRDDRTQLNSPVLRFGGTPENENRPELGGIDGKPLIQIMKLDQLNMSNDPQPDGNFDFVDNVSNQNSTVTPPTQGTLSTLANQGTPPASGTTGANLDPNNPMAGQNNTINTGPNTNKNNSVTVDPGFGRIIFPVLEPFGRTIRGALGKDTIRQPELVGKYVYDEIYRKTKSDVLQLAGKNKYFLVGQLQSSSSDVIQFAAFGGNINPAFVKVFSGSIQLRENVDYILQADLGQVKIINPTFLMPGQQIRVAYDKTDLFQVRQRAFWGTRLDYKVSKDIAFGGTFLNLTERPLITRVNIGDEPVSNSIIGLDGTYKRESGFITKLLDKLPVYNTKEKSTIQAQGEFAKLFTGSPALVNKGGKPNYYIDDFEYSQQPFNLGGSPQINWRASSAPKDLQGINYNPNTNKLAIYDNRARLAWYTIDNSFYGVGGGTVPANITTEDLKNNYVRPVNPQALFPGRQAGQIQLNEQLFDLAYFPTERGQYNYNTDLNNDGTLKNPRRNWGGITRAVNNQDTDFDNANYQYLEFWMMNPFEKGENGKVIDGITNTNNTTGGQIQFHLGSVSEDVIKDGRQNFEQGLPIPNPALNVATPDADVTDFGRATNQQFLTNSFSVQEGARDAQDIGLDGINNDQEREKFQPFLNRVPASAKAKIEEDPSGDDFKHYFNESYNTSNAKILERYKLFNGMEANSRQNTGTTFNASNYTTADNEDLNQNQTLNEVEEYFKYSVNLTEGGLKVGSNYIINEVNEFYDSNGDGNIDPAGGDLSVKWYQFRIPLREGFEKVGNIQNFKSIKFLRTVLTDWQQPVVLRMAQLQLVASSWRPYTNDLSGTDLKEVIEPNDKVFTISQVNIEENSIGSDKNSPYTLPPGFQRDRDLSTTVTRELNEHSLRLCVDGLPDNDSRGAFKVYSTGSTGLNLLNYDRIKMFVHAETPDRLNVKDEEATIFMRLGTDLNENYYEVEIPLNFTDNSVFNGVSGQNLTDDQKFQIWKKDNWFDFKLEELSDKKLIRDTSASTDRFQRFYLGKLLDSTGQIETNQKMYIRGNPTYSNIQAIMIGIRNPKSADKATKTLCIWANELRLSGFLNSDGFAATGKVNIKLADLGNVSANTKYASAGFGGLEQKISQRLQETTHDYGANANIAIDKLLPFNEKSIGLKLPLYVSIDKKTITPKYDPLRPDVRTEKSLEYRPDSVRSQYEKLIEDQTLRRSISLTNIQKVKTKPGAKKHIYDIENLSATLAYNDVNRSNVNIESMNQRNYRAGLGYNYSIKSPSLEPLKKVNGPFKSPYLKLIKDINFSPIPSNITLRGDLDRTITRTQMSNGIETGRHDIDGIRPTFEKRFLFNRTYAVAWNLTKSISFNYAANVNALIDEPRGEINEDTIRKGFTKKDSVVYNLVRGGRTKTFVQNVRVNYRLPLDKLPFTSFLSADASYNAGFTWNAGAVGISDSLGNTAQNNRDITLNARADFQKFYSKLKFITITPPPPPAPKPAPNDTTKKKLPPPPPQLKGLKYFGKFLTLIKSVNATYQQTEGTVLPGYKGRPRAFGLDDKRNNGSLYTDFLPFIVGSQDDGIYKNNDFSERYMSRGQFLSSFVTQNRTENITGRATIEPFKEFRIQVDAKITNAYSYQELYKYNPNLSNQAKNEGSRDSVIFESLAPTRTGNYSISYLAIGTFFVDDKSDNTNATFTEYENNRQVIKDRLEAENPNKNYTYNINNQDVLIPAFIAAYGGKDPKKSSYSAFPRIPLPNWRVDYAGLPTLFPGIKKVFPTISITHGYNSTYNVSNYASNGKYYGIDNINKESPQNYVFASNGDDSTGFRPINIIQSVSIIERFAPLLGINLKTKNNMNFRFEYKTDRNVALNLNNAQITDNRNEEVVFGFGYTKSNLKLPFLYRGREVILKNDVQFRVDISRRESGIVQRKIDGKPVVTSGIITYQVTPNIGYQLNQRLNIQVYCEYRLNQPKLSNSFRSSSFQFGVRFRFSLS